MQTIHDVNHNGCAHVLKKKRNRLLLVVFHSKTAEGCVISHVCTRTGATLHVEILELTNNHRHVMLAVPENLRA